MANKTHNNLSNTVEMMTEEKLCRPIPAPRRINSTVLNKIDYENVNVELINKKLNNNLENIQNNVNNKHNHNHNISSSEKVPNNKLLSLCSAMADDRVEPTSVATKSVLTEMNDLYGPNANELVSFNDNNDSNNEDNDDDDEMGEGEEENDVIPMPAPRPRRSNNRKPKQYYENVELVVLSHTKHNEKPPDLPPKTSTAHTVSKLEAKEVKQTLSIPRHSHILSSNRNNSNNSNCNSSSTSLNASLEDVHKNKKLMEGPAYKSPSPGYVKQQNTDDDDNITDVNSTPNNLENKLLRDIGSTSKLLKESIGERVAHKAKTARQRLDENLKSSTDALNSLSVEATQCFKNLGRNILNKKLTPSTSKTTIEQANSEELHKLQLNVDRPQTLPACEQIFNTIEFHSQLIHKKRPTAAAAYTNCKDEEAAFSDIFYQTPHNMRRINSEKSLNILKSNHNSPTSVSVVSQQMERSDRGVENPIRPPIRQKKYRNIKEMQELRRTVTSSDSEDISMRVNLSNSIRLQIAENRGDMATSECDSVDYYEATISSEQMTDEEGKKLLANRSLSWQYHENDSNDSEEDSCSRKSEPIYANSDLTYSNVFDMASGNLDLLAPLHMLDHIQEEISSDENRQEDEQQEGAIGGDKKSLPSKEIIKEFDPLLAAKSNSPSKINNKSNQLLLLEHLLEEDIYSSVNKSHCKSIDDTISVYSTEEDTCSLSKQKGGHVGNSVRMKAISTLRSKSIQKNEMSELEAIEQRAKPYLIKTRDSSNDSNKTDLFKATATNRSKWFVNETDDETKILSTTSAIDEQAESPPPPYSEAVGNHLEKLDKTEKMEKVEKSEMKSSRTSRLKTTLSNVRIHVDALKRKASFKSANSKSNEVKITLQMIPKPFLSPLLVKHEGPLIRFPSGVVEDILKEMQNRKAILRDRQFQTYLDQDMKTAKEIIPLEHITTIQMVSNSRVTDNATHFHCFEITTTLAKNQNPSAGDPVQLMSNPNMVMISGNSANVKHQRIAHLYGVSKESERDIWMQKILESLTNGIPTKYMCHYYRAGWCYLKTSIGADWWGAWVVLKKNQRRLIFITDANHNIEKMDLRKARCIVLKEGDETIRNLYVESGPILMIDAPPFTIYMIMSAARETKIWRHIICEVAYNNGFTLFDQQLTKFNVPVIVDKCINFVYIHGSMSEGIYRKSGSENAIVKLMAAFRLNAFNVEITRNEYNEHDVANVLKRFMRGLPERLIGKLSDSFVCISALQSATEKITLYQELLTRLSIIEWQTLKKIVGHLAFISTQSGKNKMSIQNLTMIWGPTLLQPQQTEPNDEMIYSQKEADVLTDLIVFYKNLFPLSDDELRKEQAMLTCLQKYYAAAETLNINSMKQSGDLKVWITLNTHPDNTKEEKMQVNVTITPSKTAYDICRELSGKMQLRSHEINLYEVILNGSLERPLHHSCKVFDVVLNWSYWTEVDRKHNILMVKPIDILNDVQRAVKNLATMTPSASLKFADSKTKHLKSYQCELRDGKIVITKKDKNDKVSIIREIFLHNTIAYLGCEPKRDFPWSWAITFIEKTKSQILRSRDSPYIGHVVAGTEWVLRTVWYASIWYCLYGDSVLPPADILIT